MDERFQVELDSINNLTNNNGACSSSPQVTLQSPNPRVMMTMMESPRQRSTTNTIVDTTIILETPPKVFSCSKSSTPDYSQRVNSLSLDDCC